MNGQLLEPQSEFDAARLTEPWLDNGWPDEIDPIADAPESAPESPASPSEELIGDAVHIDFSQSWEDADVLLEGLDIRPGERCLTIALGGDSALAMLLKDPAKVVAIDPNPAQIRCLELKAAAYERLSHGEFLALMGARESADRLRLYEACRSGLSPEAAFFWDERAELLVRFGLGGVGRFEQDMRRFRRLFLSFCHGRKTTEELFEPKDDLGRKRFFLFRWLNLRWRFLTWAMLSKLGLGRLARRYGVFSEANSFLSDNLKAKMESVLCVLDPAQNPYLRWILTGSHARALPAAWRPDSFEQIRENLPRLEWRVRSIGDFCDEAGREGFLYQRYNLGDYFERLSEEDYRRALVSLIGTASSGARLLYWNSLVSRSAPKDLFDRLRPLEKISDRLGDLDKVLFRGRLVIEEVL